MKHLLTLMQLKSIRIPTKAFMESCKKIKEENNGK